MDASIPQPCPAGAGDAQPGVVAEGDLFVEALAHAGAMISWSRSDEVRGLTHDVREERLHRDALEFARLCLQGQLDLEAAREAPRDDIVDADGGLRRTVEPGQGHGRISLFGKVTTRRSAYRAWHKDNLYPQDAALGWATGHRYSAGIERRAAKAAATVAFDGYYATRRPEPSDDQTGLLLSFDASGLPVLPAALREATAKAAEARAQATASAGRPDDPTDLRRATKRMAQLAAVADIPPAPRTPADILTCLFDPHRPGTPGPAAGPKATGRTVFASIRRPAADVIADAFAEADRRDPTRARPWFVLVDGNRHQIDTALTLAATRDKKITILIDLLHVIHYLWRAADCFFYKNDPAARAWVRE